MNCGNALKHGYLLGKHNRIRWSTSSKGMTIFHGVPLNTLKKGHWGNWKNWFYGPSIPATRCEHCKIVFLPYDNDTQETPKKEIMACTIIGLIFIVAAIATAGIIFFTNYFFVEIPVAFLIIGGIFSLLILLLGFIFLKHTTDKYRMRQHA